VLLFNLGVLLDDMKRPAEAMTTYEAALALDPRVADCHYNHALLREADRWRKDAIRHMARYRSLVGRTD
jgi:tetratricopeptide (TPR) repeat protein